MTIEKQGKITEQFGLEGTSGAYLVQSSTHGTANFDVRSDCSFILANLLLYMYTTIYIPICFITIKPSDDFFSSYLG